MVVNPIPRSCKIPIPAGSGSLRTRPGAVVIRRATDVLLESEAVRSGPSCCLRHMHNNFNSLAVTPSLYAWQQISQDDGQLLKKEQLVLMVASWLLGLLAVASVAVLVGGRPAEQIRRVGLLKAVGGTPGLIAGVLLAQYLLLALLAAVAGLALGRLIVRCWPGPVLGCSEPRARHRSPRPTSEWS